jgi:hypothetical protein
MRWWRGVVSSRFTSLLGLFLLGVWVVRHGVVDDPQRHRKLLWSGLVAGLLVGVPANVHYATYLTGLRPHAWDQVPAHALKTVGIPALSLAYACAFALAFPFCRSVLRVFAPIGRMSLTNYILQSIIGVALFYGCGLAMWGEVGITMSIVYIVGIFAVLTVCSAMWLKLFRQGPLEWLWRSLAYGRALPLRTTAVIAAALLVTPASADTLVIFLQDRAAGADADFVTHHEAKVRTLAEELGVSVEVRSAADAAPAEIGVTPMLVYQSHRGRSVFQGRYANLPRLRNFIRTARIVEQKPANLEKTHLPAMTVGRATVATPLKITALSGDTPSGHDDAALREQVTSGLVRGMKRFDLQDRVRLGRADRMFYLDVHPYLGNGRLYLSCEIYSQFNCHIPVYSRLDDPIVGAWDDRAELFETAGEILERELLRLIDTSPSGDAFVPVAADVPTVTWEAIGLQLPPRPAGVAATDTNLPLPEAWTLGAPETVVFYFPAPLDRYAGEARIVAAELELAGRGRFDADVATVTMGDDDLDEALQSSLNLDTAKHPTSRFEIESIELESGEVGFGEQTRGVMRGRFQLMEHAVPLVVRCTFEPIVGDDGQPQLVLHADWNIRLMKPFGLIGPDGPEPQNDTLQFDLHMTLEAKEN